MSKEIKVENLKVGDIVGIKERVAFGWKYFRYQLTVYKKIARITPKKTEVETDDGYEYSTSNTWFYEVDEKDKEMNEVVMCAKEISKTMVRLQDLKGKGLLFSAKDEDLIEISKFMKQINEILDKQNLE